MLYAIELPADRLAAVIRHPALRGQRGPWTSLLAEGFSGRQRGITLAHASLSHASLPDASLPDASLPHATLTVLHGKRADGSALLRLVGDGVDAALGAALAQNLPALPAFGSLAEPDELPGIDSAETAPAALAAGLRAGLSALLLHAPTCRPQLPPTGVHQSRVAIRRMRAKLRIFRDVLPPGEATERFAAGLRDLAAGLGPARDWDVFLAGIGQLLSAAAPGEPRLRRLLHRARKARLAAYAALPPMLEGAGFRALVWQGMALAEALDATRDGPPLHGFAQDALARRHRRLRKAGREIEALPPEALHELRLDAKKLRYAADLLAPLWPGQETRRYLRRLARLQDALGLANDATVARGLVLGLGARGWVLGLVEGFALAQAADSREMALDAWDRWRKAGRFWQEG
jgi:CHAD domain-containing protein